MRNDKLQLLRLYQFIESEHLMHRLSLDDLIFYKQLEKDEWFTQLDRIRKEFLSLLVPEMEIPVSEVLLGFTKCMKNNYPEYYHSKMERIDSCFILEGGHSVNEACQYIVDHTAYRKW